MGTDASGPLRPKWFILLFSILLLACAEPAPSGSGDGSYYANSVISREKGMVAKYFSSRVIVSSNFIDDVEFNSNVEGTLPPGVSWNADRGVFEGTPTLAGFYNVRVYYRDSVKGTTTAGDAMDDQWYYNDFELKMYDELTEETGG
ncbi:MAG: putative Ig domain-containing protein [Planctomycetes bacterium]|nr:putative Ig domain-containing protein [Planctomycetota bacterium]